MSTRNNLKGEFLHPTYRSNEKPGEEDGMGLPELTGTVEEGDANKKSCIPLGSFINLLPDITKKYPAMYRRKVSIYSFFTGFLVGDFNNKGLMNRPSFIKP